MKRRELFQAGAALAGSAVLPAGPADVATRAILRATAAKPLSDDTIDAIMYALAAATQVPTRILFGIDVVRPGEAVRTFVAQRLNGNEFRVVAPVELRDVTITGKVSV